MHRINVFKTNKILGLGTQNTRLYWERQEEPKSYRIRQDEESNNPDGDGEEFPPHVIDSPSERTIFLLHSNLRS